jgi:hypothetical protein
LIVGPLKQNKIKKSKGFALKGHCGRGYFPAGRVQGGLRDGPPGTKRKSPERGAFLGSGEGKPWENLPEYGVGPDEGIEVYVNYIKAEWRCREPTDTPFLILSGKSMLIGSNLLP